MLRLGVGEGGQVGRVVALLTAAASAAVAAAVGRRGRRGEGKRGTQERRGLGRRIASDGGRKGSGRAKGRRRRLGGGKGPTEPPLRRLLGLPPLRLPGQLRLPGLLLLLQVPLQPPARGRGQVGGGKRRWRLSGVGDGGRGRGEAAAPRRAAVTAPDTVGAAPPVEGPGLLRLAKVAIGWPLAALQGRGGRRLRQSGQRKGSHRRHPLTGDTQRKHWTRLVGRTHALRRGSGRGSA